MCKPRSGWKGRWGNLDICIEEKYKCDGVLHCREGEDETGCAEEATERCEGNRQDGFKCDKYYKQPAGGHCLEEEDLLCTARDGRYAGFKICVGKKFHCDNFLQCEDGADEAHCEAEYQQKQMFTSDQKYICRSPYLEVRNEENETGRFFPMRGVR